jgi:hypothetical protein
MLAKPLILDGQLTRQIQQGDVAAGAEIIASLATVGAGTLTGALLAQNILSRTGSTAAFTDTTDTAANIVAALAGQAVSGTGVQNGTSWRLKYQNNVAFDCTLAAGTGVTLAGASVIPGLSAAELLIQVKNGQPSTVQTATLDGTTAVVTGMSQAATALVAPGMSVSGTGVPASTTVLSVQQGTGVTLSNNTTIAGTNVALTFTPAVTITVTDIAPTNVLQKAKQVTSAASGTTYIAGDMTGAEQVFLTSSANGANAMTTRTAAQLIADQGSPPVGYSWRLRINQTGNNTLTLTGGTGVTISGTNTVATTVVREYLMVITGASTITMTNIGALAA